MKDEFKEASAIDIYKQVLQNKLQRFPREFFSSQGSINMTNVCIPVIKYMIEEKLEFKDGEIKGKITREIFRKYKLGGMLSHIFNDSPYAAINVAYPNKYKEWEISRNA